MTGKAGGVESETAMQEEEKKKAAKDWEKAGNQRAQRRSTVFLGQIYHVLLLLTCTAVRAYMHLHQKHMTLHKMEK